ncbi:MAG: hypothetical protein ACLTSZ_03950 [Lachnospiraceae bacterium]
MATVNAKGKVTAKKKGNGSHHGEGRKEEAQMQRWWCCSR